MSMGGETKDKDKKVKKYKEELEKHKDKVKKYKEEMEREKEK